MLWTGGDCSRLPLRHYEGLPAGDFVHPRDEEHPLQVRGGRKPFHMLVNILAYCPSDMEQQSIMFQYMFLQRLPVTLRTLLEQQKPGDTDKKKKLKFSSYLRKFRVEQLQSHI
jgi:hypothetical protein